MYSYVENNAFFLADAELLFPVQPTSNTITDRIWTNRCAPGRWQRIQNPSCLAARYQQQHGRFDRPGQGPALENGEPTGSGPKADKQETTLEIALFEYGNSNLNAETGYIRLVQPLGADLDGLSEKTI